MYGNVQQGAEPVGEDVDSSVGIVDVCKSCCRIAVSTRSRRIPRPRNGIAVEDDDEQGYDVHDDEHGRSDPKGDDIVPFAGRNTHLHKRDTELDRHNRDAVKNLEEEEPLLAISSCQTQRF